MKNLLLSAILLALPLSAETPRIVVAPGPWAVCDVNPQAFFCATADPTQAPQWSVWIKGTDPVPVVAYLVTISYTDQSQNAGRKTFVLQRNENAVGYSCEWITLGRVTITGTEVTPLTSYSQRELRGSAN